MPPDQGKSRTTIDCTRAHSDLMEMLPQCASTEAIARFGLHREDAALLTCIAPLPTQSNHLHFIDGPSGGKTLAAMRVKAGA